MKSSRWFCQTLAVTAALCAVLFLCQFSGAAPVYVDPSLSGTATDDSNTAGNDVGFDGTYRIGDVSEVGETESKIWVKFQLPGPSLGATSILSARLILGTFDHMESGDSPGLSAAPVTDIANGGDGDNWTNATIHNGLLAIDGSRVVNYFNDDATPPGTMQDLDITNWFGIATGEGLGEMLTVQLSGGAGYAAMSGGGWMVLGSGAQGIAPVAFSGSPAIRLELTLIPEPSSAILAIMAVSGLALFRRRKSH